MMVAALAAGAGGVRCVTTAAAAAAAGARRRIPASPTTSIKLGGSTRSAGPASAYGDDPRGREGATSSIVNAKGGVDGRKIDFIMLDDGYEPPKARRRTRARLVEQDKVFALFNTLGTPNNLAIWDYLNQQKVPQLFVATGASDWGTDIGQAPVHDRLAAQLRLRGQGLRASTSRRRSRTPRSRCSTRTTASARTCSAASRRASRAPSIKVVAKQSYEVDRPDGRAADRASSPRSGADTFLDITTPKFGRAGDRDGGQDRLEAAAHPQQRRRVQEPRAQAGRA